MIVLPFVHSLLFPSLQGLNYTSSRPLNFVVPYATIRKILLNKRKKFWKSWFSEEARKEWAAEGLVSTGRRGTGYS